MVDRPSDHPTNDWDAAILAGGRSRRLGGCDKAQLLVGGTRVIDRLVAAIGPHVRHLAIVTNVPGAYPELGLPAIADRLPGRGVLAGIEAALAASDASQLLVVACDMPFLHSAFVADLMCAGRDAPIAVPRAPDGRYPVCASIARTCHETVRELLEAGHLSFRDLLGSLQVHELEPEALRKHDPDGVLLLNVNTPFDYARALTACGPDWRASYPHDAT
ncbi:MAG: NTP transferase domain-containing protein [Luteitalea sp.]|nr:NTP transferase domain-containing protein [Luteitalea sp.]